MYCIYVILITDVIIFTCNMQVTRCSALWQSNPVAARKFYQYVHLHTTVSATGILSLIDFHCTSFGRECGDLMVSALVSRSSILGSSIGLGHSVLFLGKTFNCALHLATGMTTINLLGTSLKLLFARHTPIFYCHYAPHQPLMSQLTVNWTTK